MSAISELSVSASPDPTLTSPAMEVSSSSSAEEVPPASPATEMPPASTMISEVAPTAHKQTEMTPPPTTPVHNSEILVDPKSVEAMSLSNILNPPPQHSDMKGAPSTPVLGPTAPPTAPVTPENMSSPQELEASSPLESISDVDMVDAGDSPATDTAAVPEFRCMNDEFEECHTGQTSMKLSRKVISDHFGRNKACTRMISEWPLFCRKHYQRATYNNKTWQMRKVSLIIRQFDIIEAQFPNTTYTVTLKKSEEKRIQNYGLLTSINRLTDEEAALRIAPQEGKHFEAPVSVLLIIGEQMGPHKTIDEAKAIMGKIHTMLEKEDTTQVPAIEFLPEIGARRGIRASDTPQAPKTPKSQSRTSRKGSVQKTTTPTRKPRTSVQLKVESEA